VFRSILKWGAISLGVLIVIGALVGSDETTKTDTAKADSKTPGQVARDEGTPKPTKDTDGDGTPNAKDGRPFDAETTTEDKDDSIGEEVEETLEDVEAEIDEAVEDVEDEPTPGMTRGQENALESAESYLDSGDFSKKGLAEQLDYEEFSKADVRFAIKHVDVNWKAEAVGSAESYLDSGSFSRSGLADQLAYEGFTPAQVQHAVSKVY